MRIHIQEEDIDEEIERGSDTQTDRLRETDEEIEREG